MEYIYDKILANNLNGKDKQQLKIVLQRYNNRLQMHKDIVDKAPQKRSPEKYNNKVIEDIITRSRGRLKKNYTEEEIEALKQKKRDIVKRHYENNLEKRKLQKAEWTNNNRPLVNERARVYRAKKNLRNNWFYSIFQKTVINYFIYIFFIFCYYKYCHINFILDMRLIRHTDLMGSVIKHVVTVGMGKIQTNNKGKELKSIVISDKTYRYNKDKQFSKTLNNKLSKIEV